jgi:hypothetical protein
MMKSRATSRILRVASLKRKKKELLRAPRRKRAATMGSRTMTTRRLWLKISD